MANYSENNIKFAFLNYEDILKAIEQGKLNEYDIVYGKDTKQQYLISSSLEPIPIRSRVRIYGSAEAAMADVKETKETYAGEILSIRDGDKFVAYIVNQFEDGEYYIAPIYSDKMIDYDGLQNAPIKNINGGVIEPVVLAELSDGYYKITGHFITPKGTDISSLVGTFVIVETKINETTLKESKLIKRIESNNIFDYEIDNEGNYKCDKYATEDYIKEQGFATQEDLEQSLIAFRASMEAYVQEYVAVTCTLLVRHLVDDELNMRYSSDDDIKHLFGENKTE